MNVQKSFQFFFLAVVTVFSVVAVFSTVRADIVDFQRTVVVSPVGAPDQNGAALLAAIAGITDASEINPYLLKVEPGVYDLGTDSLNMKEYVDVEGSGELVTTITGQVGQGAGTVVGAANTELRFVTIENTGGNGTAIAMYSNSSSVQLKRVTLRALSNTNKIIGLFTENVKFLRIKDSNIVARGGPNSISFGMSIRNSIAARITNSAIGAIVGGQAYGMSNSSSIVTMVNVHITGQNAAVLNVATNGASRRLSISHAKIISTGPGKPAIQNDDGFNVQLAFCELKLAPGGVVATGGGTVDQKFCFLRSNTLEFRVINPGQMTPPLTR